MRVCTVCHSNCIPWTYEPRHNKTNKVSVHPAKIQISLGIRPVWSESSLSTWRKLGSLATHLVHSEDSDQAGRMPRLIWVFAGRSITLLVLSCRCSYYWMVKPYYSNFRIITVILLVKFLRYHKFPKYSDTQKICCNHSKIWTMWLYQSNESKQCRQNGIQCRPWSDCSSRSLIWVCTVCPGISVRKLRIITVIKVILFVKFLQYIKIFSFQPI